MIRFRTVCIFTLATLAGSLATGLLFAQRSSERLDPSANPGSTPTSSDARTPSEAREALRQRSFPATLTPLDPPLAPYGGAQAYLDPDGGIFELMEPESAPGDASPAEAGENAP